MKLRTLSLTLLATAIVLHGCSLIGGGKSLDRVGKTSSKTGATWGVDENSGHDPQDFTRQAAAPGLVFIEGGTFIMGGGEQDIAFAYDNRERQVTVGSFYIDETEVENAEYRFFLSKMAIDSGEAKFEAMYPDTSVWFRELAYNDPYVRYYFSHPGFNMYPVVGVDWHQANEYCNWRTNYVNKISLEEDEEHVPYPAYRLPSEAEWEYAARGGLEQQLYPWEGKSLRWTAGKTQGMFRANLKRGRGDYGGKSNKGNSNLVEGLNDGYFIPGPVKAFYPNDFGLYNMSGNVAEWVFDTYRVLSYEDVEDLNPGRRRGKTDDLFTDDDRYNEARTLLFNPDAQAPNNGAFDNVKVYRGGSWADIAYYLTTGSRRFYSADSSTATIGFRCAMIRVGSPQ
jgi:sulfatase modifying factor 1